MEKELFLFLGAIFTAVIGYGAARLTSSVQLQIAKDNSEKDLKLQSDRLLDERLKAEVKLERDKLEILHRTLSRISFENSQTMSYIQSTDTELSEFRARYIENCDRLHEALAITDLYYPSMSEGVREIFGQANRFWGFQEGVINIDVRENNPSWMAHMEKVLDAGGKVNKRVENLQHKISGRGKELNQLLHRTSR